MYTEVFPQQSFRSYFCNCYGTVDMIAGNDRVLSTLTATDLNTKMRAAGFKVYDPDMTMFTQAGGGTLTSLNSYGYNGLSNMYGPKFNANTQAVFTRANGSTSNQIVTVAP